MKPIKSHLCIYTPGFHHWIWMACLMFLLKGEIGWAQQTDATPSQNNDAAQATTPDAPNIDSETKPVSDPCAPSLDNDIHGYPAQCNLPPAPKLERGGVASLNGGGMLDISGHSRPIILGTTLLGGYETDFADASTQGASFAGFSGYAATTFAPPRMYLVTQNSFSLVSYRVANGTNQYFDTFSLSAGDNNHGTLGWEAHLDNAYGNDSLRLIAPINTAVLSNVDVPSPGTPAYSLQTNDVLDNNASFAIHQNLSRARSLRYTFQNSYRTIFGLDENSDTQRLRVDYRVAASPFTTWGLSDELARETGAVRCSTESIQGNYQRQIMHRSVVQVSGGPAFGTSGCVTTITGNFEGSFVSQLAHYSSLYASASRRLNDSIVIGATWEDTAQVGLIQSLGPRSMLRADVGYLRGTRPKSKEDFSSTFEGGTLSRNLGGGFSLQVSLRRLDYSNGDIAGAGSVAPNRTQVVFGFSFSTNPRSAAPEEVTVR